MLRECPCFSWVKALLPDCVRRGGSPAPARARPATETAAGRGSGGGDASPRQDSHLRLDSRTRGATYESSGRTERRQLLLWDGLSEAVSASDDWLACEGPYHHHHHRDTHRHTDTDSHGRSTPSPRSVRRDTPSPTSVKKSTPSPTSVRRDTPSPTSVRRGSHSPTGVRRGSPSPTSVRRGSPSPTGVRRGSPSPTGVRRFTPSPTSVKKSSSSPTSVSRCTASPTSPRRCTPSPTSARRSTWSTCEGDSDGDVGVTGDGVHTGEQHVYTTTPTTTTTGVHNNNTAVGRVLPGVHNAGDLGHAALYDNTAGPHHSPPPPPLCCLNDHSPQSHTPPVGDQSHHRAKRRYRSAEPPWSSSSDPESPPSSPSSCVSGRYGFFQSSLNSSLFSSLSSSSSGGTSSGEERCPSPADTGGDPGGRHGTMGQSGSSSSAADHRRSAYDPPPGNNPELFLLEQEHKRERTGSFGSSRKKDRYVINKQEKFSLGEGNGYRPRPSSDTERWLSSKDKEKLKKLTTKKQENNNKNNKDSARDKGGDQYELSILRRSPRQGPRLSERILVPEATKDKGKDKKGKDKKERGRSHSFSSPTPKERPLEVDRRKSSQVSVVESGASTNGHVQESDLKIDENNGRHLLRAAQREQIQVPGAHQQLQQQQQQQLQQQQHEEHNNGKNLLSKQDKDKERVVMRRLESYRRKKAALAGQPHPAREAGSHPGPAGGRQSWTEGQRLSEDVPRAVPSQGSVRQEAGLAQPTVRTGPASHSPTHVPNRHAPVHNGHASVSHGPAQTHAPEAGPAHSSIPVANGGIPSSAPTPPLTQHGPASIQNSSASSSRGPTPIHDSAPHGPVPAPVSMPNPWLPPQHHKRSNSETRPPGHRHHHLHQHSHHLHHHHKAQGPPSQTQVVSRNTEGTAKSSGVPKSGQATPTHSSARSTPVIIARHPSPAPVTLSPASHAVAPPMSGVTVPAFQAQQTSGNNDLYAFVPVSASTVIYADQNRNKTTKTAAAASTSTSSLKRPLPPDVVTNSVVATPGAAEEICRLEALCETRTKQLNIARMQLKASAQGFDAMTVLVKYLTDELDAFSCPEVTAKLKAVKGQLADAQLQIDVLAEDKASLEKSLGELKKQHAAKVTQVKEVHREELEQLRARLQTEREAEVEQVVEKYSLEVTTLKAFLEKNIADMKSKHEKTLQDQDEKHSKDVEALKEEHGTRSKGVPLEGGSDLSAPSRDLQKQHERRLEEITRTFENIKLTLSEKVETLRGECEEMRNREAHLEERTQREADMKIHMALAQYKHLPAEIESLKAVMEMRNQELHELRHKKLELEKQLEEIPKARQKIISLQQKVENLEAVIQIKADYEKQLTEKHQILLRKFDKEYKANKRLSMDNEELAWRLANSAESPDLLRRSISHSPTRASPPDTAPEVVRRRKSPACSMPTSPRNQTEFERSPVMLNSPPKTNLKRSGTYDLLNKDPDEKDGMKQSDV